MPKYLTITEARKKLLNLPDKLIDEPIIITKKKDIYAILNRFFAE